MMCNIPVWSIVPKALTDDSGYDYGIDTPNNTSPNGLAVINVSGVLGKQTGDYGYVDVDDINAALAKAVSDPTVSSILLVFNSPGGDVTGIPELGTTIAQATQTKPVYAFTDTVCCSAAYWLASNTNGIFATPSSCIGSIGVFAIYEDHTKAIADAGVTLNIFSAGTYKLLGSPFKPMTDDEKAIIQGEVDKTYANFKAVVGANRGISDDVMQGQVFSGDEALANGLCDMLVNDVSEVLAMLDTPAVLDTPAQNNNA